MTQPHRDPQPPATLQVATLAGVAILILLNGLTWFQTRGFRRDLNEHLTDINKAMTDVTAKVEASAKAAPAKPRGPDPNKVYPVNTNGSPAKGPASAPITIAEFSDFQ